MLMRLKIISVTFLLTDGWIAGGAAQPTPQNPPGIWSNLPNITENGVQTPRQEHGVALLGDDVYVLGGILPFNGSTYPTTDIVQKFNLKTGAWTKTAPMPAALNHANIAVIDGKIYYFGGLEATDFTYWKATGASAVYHPSTDKWTILSSMPEGRAIGSAATLVVGETIYLPGGLLYTNTTHDQEGTTTMFTSYNLRTKKWKILPDLPAPRDHAGKGIYGDMLYVLGGRAFGNKNVVDTVFGFNLSSHSWSTRFAPMPTPRGGVASATIGSQIFTAGGEGNPNTSTAIFPQMQAYDAARNTWIKYADMVTPLHGTASVTYKGQIIIPGGAPVTGGDPSPFALKFRPSRRRS